MDRGARVTPGEGAPRWIGVALVCGALAGAPSSVAAQQAETPTAAQAVAPQPLSVSPGGAFARALLVPGWGHVAIGSYTRGGFYFVLESATAYAFLRTRHRLSEAKERAALRESVVRAGLAAEGVTDPAEVQTRVEQDAVVGSFEDLIESREGQQEDLVAFGIFLLFLSGADAYVSAHLARFPAPIEVQFSPVGGDRAEVALSIALPNF